MFGFRYSLHMVIFCRWTDFLMSFWFFRQCLSVFHRSYNTHHPVYFPVHCGSLLISVQTMPNANKNVSQVMQHKQIAGWRFCQLKMLTTKIFDYYFMLVKKGTLTDCISHTTLCVWGQDAFQMAPVCPTFCAVCVCAAVRGDNLIGQWTMLMRKSSFFEKSLWWAIS